MQLREIFNTKIQERIEPVVKVSDRRPAILLQELKSLVVTKQWELHLRRILDAYTNAADSEDEQGIGIWINGFFGSGKSLLMKVLGLLLAGGELAGESVHEVFLSRLDINSPEQANLQRLLTVCQRKMATTYVGGNLHAQQGSSTDSLSLIVFKLFASQRGFTHNWPLAWAIEYQIDERGRTADFRQRVAELSGVSWTDIAPDSEFYLEALYQAAAEVMPENFSGGASSVERAVNSILQSGITPALLVERLRRWCEARDGGNRRHKLLIQLDELGQWIAGGNANDRTMQVQALSEAIAESGTGRLWLAVTAHGDVQALKQNVQQEYYAKITQRFALPCKLSNEDISQVVEKRVLQKTQAARTNLEARFNQKSGELTDLGTLRETQRVYPTPDANRFALLYPYMPWTVAVIPDVVKGIAQAAGRDEALTGSNRTMIGVIQGGIIETPGLLDDQVGRLLCLADLYDQLSTDVPIETKTDLNRIKETVPEATEMTKRVARALYLLGQAGYVPCYLDNVVRALVDSLDDNLSLKRKQVKEELERLVAAGYAKQVGEQYNFLSTQQRGFQDKIRAQQDKLELDYYDLGQNLKDYDNRDVFRFDKVLLAGREIELKLELDGRNIRTSSAPVLVRVYSPFQRTIDPQVSNDSALKQRSAQEPDNILFRLDDVPKLRQTLALALATKKVADEIISMGQAAGPDLEIARKAKQDDLPPLTKDVEKLLTQAVWGGMIFFRGSVYQLADGENAAGAVRATLAQLLPDIYTRFSDLTHRLTNEEKAVKAALNNNTTDPDLQALGVFKADGTLNESNALISSLRARLPDDQYTSYIKADDLRNEFTRPPFGWDGNAIKAGLALLLRHSACRLIDNDKIITDPSEPEALLLLSKELRFRTLRVQGVKSELGVEQLQQIRGFLDIIFDVRPSLVAASLSNTLGEKLTESAKTSKEVEDWASTAGCPLPISFGKGRSIVEELLNNNLPQARLPRFLEQAETLQTYTETLEKLVEFRKARSTEFAAVREFFQNMLNAELALPELRRFISDYRTLNSERTITQPERWNELSHSYQAAQQAVANQVSTWQQEATKKVAALEAGLEHRVREAKVPEEKLGEEVAKLDQSLQEVRERLNHSNSGFSEVRSLLSKVTNTELNLQGKIAELKTLYKPKLPDPEELHLTWAGLAGTTRITSAEELEATLDTLKKRVLQELDGQKIIIIE